MASVWQKSLVYLGLVDEEQLAAETEAEAPRHVGPRRPATEETPIVLPQQQGQIRGRRVEPPPNARRSVEQRSTLPSGAAAGAVRPVPSAEAQCDVIEVQEFDHAKLLADRIRDRTPVVLDLRDTEPEMVRRIVDFSTGLTYALDGAMRKTTDGVILVLPPRVSIGREEKRRLSELGLYDLDDNRR